MIFQHTYKLILRPVNPKTNSRRLCKRGDYATCDADGQIDAVYTASGCLKWRVGNTYAVQPGRGKPAIWIGSGGTLFDDPLLVYSQAALYPRENWGTEAKKWLRDHGYREARIRITVIRRERLQDIDPDAVLAEGCICDLDTGLYDTGFNRWDHELGIFKRLWDAIHTAPGTTWNCNPEVWALSFALAVGDVT